MSGGSSDPVKVSSPDKVLFPAIGATKAELVDYYRRVGETMLPSLEGRPLTLHRFPRGVEAKGFMQKNAADHFPDSIERFEVPKNEDGVTVYPIVTTASDIAYLANQNTITFHIWTSRRPDVDRPDWLILDLDPADDDPEALERVRAVALAAREVLQRFDLDAVPVVTGSKGFHLWVALDATLGHDQVSTANRALAGLVALAEPDAATTEFLKKDRGRRVFVDWLRSRRGATVVAPLSVRARPNASIAVPVTWNEVPEVRPDQWSMADPDHVDEVLARIPPCSLDLEPATLPVDEIVAEACSAGVDLDTPFDRFGRR